MAQARGVYRTVSASGHEYARIEDRISTDIARSLYEQGGYQPPFDELPTKAEYEASKKKTPSADRT